MPRMKRKGDLPTKPCRVCGRPFAWRRKWAACWDEVSVCSEACRRKRGRRAGEGGPAEPDPSTIAGNRR